MAVIPAKERERLLDSVCALLSTFTFSHFEYEAAARHEIRAWLCLRGTGWQKADDVAAGIVAEALQGIGAKRPSYEEGQWAYVVGPDYCRHCHGPMSLEDQAAGHRYCSSICIRSAKRIEEQHAETCLAHGFATARKQVPLKCHWCGNGFMARDPHTRTCSPECASKIAKSTPPERHCEQCGKGFRNRWGSRFCSTRCAARARNTDLPERCCNRCGTTYKPKAANSFYCEETCMRAAQRDRRAKPGPEPRPCAQCGDSFTPAKVDAIYCSPKCGAQARRDASRTLVPKDCPECGETFTPAIRNSQKYCCSACMKAAGRRSLKAA